MKTIPMALVMAVLAGCTPVSPSRPVAVDAVPEEKPAALQPAPKASKEIVLFDGKSLENWKKTNFGGEGEVTVENGLLIMDRGGPLTGVTWTGPDLPKTNYEVTLDAKRIDGTDFFCGIGFPVGESTASFVAGGWGGGICGISLLDGDAAADNETSSLQDFEKDKWYHFRLRVTPAKIEVWLDDEQIVDTELKDRRVEIHPAMFNSLPFGLTSFQTIAAYRNVKLRKLD